MKRAILWGAPVVALLALVFWRLSAERAAAQDTSSQAASRRSAPQAVDMAIAGPALIEQSREGVGTVDSPMKVDISAKTSGRIDYLVLREGDAVRKGDVLVRLNPSDLEGQLLQQQAAVSEARARLAEAQLGKVSNDAAIEGGLLQQQANLETAKAEWELARQSYEAQIADSKAAVVDATARVSSAESDVRNNVARVASAGAEADNAKQRLERFERLSKEGFIANQMVDDARANLTVSEKAVEVAKAQLESARSARDSAKAQLNSAQNQLQISKNRASASVKTAEARVDQAQSALKVAQANRTGTAAYRANLDALSAGVASAQAQLDQARAKRDDMVLRSSIDGIVTARQADPGSMATTGQPILTVQSLDWLLVKTSLPIELADKVNVGQSVQVRIEGFGNRVWTGRVSHVNPSADSQTRQFDFQVKLDNADRTLRPGMFGRIVVPVDRSQVPVAIPKSAIDDSNGKTTVRVVTESGEVAVREVEVGATDGQTAEIRSGLKPGERVVQLSYSTLREGQKVRLPQGGKGRP